MKFIIFNIINIFKNLIFKRRFIRLNPLLKGKIYFYDRNNRNCFFINSRDLIDSITADQIFTYHDYDLDVLYRKKDIEASYAQILKEGKIPLIIDCGSNIGLSSLYFSKIFPLGKIYGVEPNTENINLARKNCISYRNIEFKQAAIGCKSGFVEIENTSVNSNAFRVNISKSSSSISMISINDILKKNKKYKLFIVKIDIEGFEKNLFSNNTNWINDTMLMIIELHDWMLPKKANSLNFLKSISKYNRDFIYKNENIFSIKID